MWPKPSWFTYCPVEIYVERRRAIVPNKVCCAIVWLSKADTSLLDPRSSIQVNQNTCGVLVQAWYDYYRSKSPGTTHGSFEIRTMTTFFTDHSPLLLFDNDVMDEITSGLERARGCHASILQGVIARQIETWKVDESCLSFAVVNTTTILVRQCSDVNITRYCLQYSIRSIPRSLQRWVSTKSSISQLTFFHFIIKMSHKTRSTRSKYPYPACKHEFRRNSRSQSCEGEF